MRSALALLAALTLAGCLPATAPISPDAPAPAFRPEVFFAGRSHGDPVVAIRSRGAETMHVESRGAAQPDGTFRLDQTITHADGRADERTWIMAAAGQGRYTATLTPDARGPVSASAVGNTFHIHYRMGRFTTMDQTLRLHPDGRVADNVGTVRLLGLPIARVTETITRDSQ